MSEEQRNNPLHGVKLEALLTELVTHYGFDILSEQININCFKSNPSIQSSLKFLRKAPWARNKVEAFYLYKFKQLPRPSDEEHELQPGERSIPIEQKTGNPAQIRKGDREFFDDPASGPAKSKKSKKTKNNKDQGSHFSSKLGPAAKATKPRRAAAETASQPAYARPSDTSSPQDTADPWGKWRDKNASTNED
jgi:uncharacterized protein (DUF2132 family)